MAVYLSAAAAYVGLMAWYQSAGEAYFTFRDLLAPRVNDVLIATFFFMVGASVGSFLNVVAWRLPRGRSVNGHSHCPRCGHRLSARDNLPVLGWLWLKGRCRTCGLPISPRYPVVEASVGISFLLVGTAEIFRWNLPYQFGHTHGGPLWTPFVDSGILVTLGYHLVALSAAWAMGLIRIDQLPIPNSLARFAAVTLIGGVLAAPSVGVVPWQLEIPSGWPIDPWWQSTPAYRSSSAVMPLSEQWVQAALRLLTALAATGFYARLLSRGLAPTADLKYQPTSSATRRLFDLVLIVSVPAIVAGWQATIAIVLVTSLLAGLADRPRIDTVFRRWGFGSPDALGRLALLLPLVLTLQLTFWAELVASRWWPSVQASRGTMLAWAGASLLVPLWLHQRPSQASGASDDESTSAASAEQLAPENPPSQAKSLN